MQDRKGQIWIASNGGLSVYYSGNFTNYTIKNGLLSKTVKSLLEDRKGTVWAGTQKGLNRFDDSEGKGKFSDFCIGQRRLNMEVRRILEDSRGYLWLSSPTGLYRISPAKEKITRFTDKNGLPHNSVIPLLEDRKKNLWIGTQGGLSCFKDGKFVNYSTVDGLPHKKCYALVEDDRGYLWIGTGKGLARFDSKTFKTYTREHGFLTENWIDAAFFKDSQGNLWLGSANGVSRFYPEAERINRVPPPVYITAINVLEQEVLLSDFYQLEYDQNYLKFQFVGLSFSAPGSVVYKYRLEGIEKDWQETRERRVAYPYLPSGNYRFQVKAVNHDGIESRKPAEIRFRISPPFWKTWWFRSFLVLVLLFLVGFLAYWRSKRIHEKMTYEARTRQLMMGQRMELLGILAAGAVHDLKNLLAVILGYSKMAEKSYNRQNQPENHQYKDNTKMTIEKITKTASTAIQVVKQMQAFTRQKYDENAPVNLVDLLKDILDILAITRPSEVKIRWQPPQEEIWFLINPGRFQQLVMNLCLNAIQAMPGGGELQISLSKIKTSNKKEQIKLEISDTGIGINEGAKEKIFDPFYTTKQNGKGTGLGLFVVKQIVDNHKGKIDIHCKPGQGTRFSITFDSKAYINKK